MLENVARPQQPRQIEWTILPTLASSRSTAGLPVPSGGPFIRRLRPWDEESAVPSELVPGAAALLPKAPPELVECCIAMLMPRPEAAPIQRLTQSAANKTESFVMSNIPPNHSNDRLSGAVPADHSALHAAKPATGAGQGSAQFQHLA